MVAKFLPTMPQFQTSPVNIQPALNPAGGMFGSSQQKKWYVPPRQQTGGYLTAPEAVSPQGAVNPQHVNLGGIRPLNIKENPTTGEMQTLQQMRGTASGLVPAIGNTGLYDASRSNLKQALIGNRRVGRRIAGQPSSARAFRNAGGSGPMAGLPFGKGGPVR